MRPSTLAPIVVALVLSACAGSSALPIRRVVLYRNGVGYFERAGRVHGERWSMQLAPHEIDDALATFTAVEREGGVVSADVPLPRPRDERRDGAHDRRGRRHHHDCDDERACDDEHDDDEDDDDDDDESARLEVRFDDDGAHDVRVAYSTPVPAWRAAYRVVLPEGPGEGQALLSAWAVVHNVSPESWEGVSLELVTGEPFAYAADLATPRFVPRPDVSGRLVVPTAVGAVSSESVADGAGDGDGIPDATDLCPADAEDRDGFEDGDGCPDPDNDRDRILDVSDRCPNDPETYNGTEDDDGCPDRGRVVIESSQIAILDRIYFARGDAAISPRSAPIADAIAATLVGNPQIARAEIRGHASNDESDAWALSARRAAAVRTHLVQRGVATDRLVIRPFGASQPIAPGDTPAARERNRRVEIEILSTDDTTVANTTPTPPAAPPRIDAAAVARSTTALAVGRDTEGETRYAVAARVTVRARATAMIALASASVPGEDVYLFRPDAAAPGSDVHPFRAARLANRTGLALIPGTVAILGRGRYAGAGLLDRTEPGASALVPYALDPRASVDVAREERSEPHRATAIVRGQLVLEDTSIVTTTYTTDAPSHAPARLFVRHRVTHGYTPRSLPPSTEVAGSGLLAPLPLARGRRSHLAIEETAVRERTVALLYDLETDVTPYLARSSMPDDVMSRLRAVLSARQTMRDRVTRVGTLRRELSDLSSQSAEVATSLGTLGPQRTAQSTALAARLRDRLRDIATRTETTSRALTEEQAAHSEARAALEEALRELRYEPPRPTD
ncbi:MAG: OmpA family protein [Deltaproteobacteria bacterium]|nr:OmpA family protein [Deltaproteobacteria bacterium]